MFSLVQCKDCIRPGQGVPLIRLRSYQLQADVATGGTTSGALVQFAESTMGQNLTTETPWIAYVSCDYNESSTSQEWGARGI